MDLRDRVKLILERTGWSQRELARQAGLAGSHISLIVTRLGQNVRPDTLRAIATAAGVSEVWLLTGRGSPDDVEGQLVEREPPAPVLSESDRPHFNTLPYWAELLARAKAMRPAMEPWVWDAIAVARPMLAADPTPLMIAELADWTQRHESVIRQRAERKEVGAPPRTTARPATMSSSSVTAEPPAPAASDNPFPLEESGPSGVRPMAPAAPVLRPAHSRKQG